MDDSCYLLCGDALPDHGVLGYLQVSAHALCHLTAIVACYGSRRHTFSYHAQDSALKYSLVPLHSITKNIGKSCACIRCTLLYRVTSKRQECWVERASC